ncbi:MAG TPA: hypothetical protein VHL59_04200 [Thermoanaerobaculia bacterium]|nr:hypothetical protein [Thermoanaerobaculia bacterium]
MLLALAPLVQGQSDIEFDPAITQAEFEQFSRLVAQSIYATPVDPARARGLFGFDIGVAVTAVPVDPNAAFWQRAVGNDFTISDYVAVPRLVASKGLSVATISAMYSRVNDTDIEVWGGALDVPILSGGIVKPTLALRGAYSQLRGVEEYDLETYGVELFLSKGFGPITPYAAVGRTKLDAEGRISPTVSLTDDSSGNRYTLGVKLSLLIPKITVEATQGEERSYAAKVSFGL